jgi:hypothetical protein
MTSRLTNRPKQSSPTTLTQLKALGFDSSIVESPRRIIASVSGKEKGGKTHLALTAPGPIFYFNMDNGGEGVINRFQATGKEIYSKPIRVAKTAPQGKHKETWDNFKESLYAVCDYNKGTGILDTSSELYELARLAAFGKLEQVRPHHYSLVNSEWQKEILQAMYDSDMNWILIHKVKPVWVNDVRTKDYEMAGFSDTGYKVQMKISTFRETYEDDDGEKKIRFGITVDDCRNPAWLIGQSYRTVIPITQDSNLLVDPIVNFEYLLNLVHGEK